VQSGPRNVRLRLIAASQRNDRIGVKHQKKQYNAHQMWSLMRKQDECHAAPAKGFH
jgi:hypothetical protein